MKNARVSHFYDVLDLILSATGLSFSSKQCKHFLQLASARKYDVIIVPGIPFNGKQWNTIMKGRIYWSKYLLESDIAKHVIYSGAAVHSPWVESVIMANYAEAIGIPKTKIFTEEKAEHSTENVFFSYKMAIDKGFKHIGFASDPFQSKMLRKFIYYNIGSDISLIPIVFDILRDIESQMMTPTINIDNAFTNNFIPLSKREGFKDRFKGTLGKRINAR